MATFSPFSEVWRTTPDSSLSSAQPPHSKPTSPLKLSPSDWPDPSPLVGPTRPIRARAAAYLVLHRDSTGVWRFPVLGVRARHDYLLRAHKSRGRAAAAPRLALAPPQDRADAMAASAGSSSIRCPEDLPEPPEATGRTSSTSRTHAGYPRRLTLAGMPPPQSKDRPTLLHATGPLTAFPLQGECALESPSVSSPFSPLYPSSPPSRSPAPPSSNRAAEVALAAVRFLPKGRRR
jgi:hypothetical protein